MTDMQIRLFGGPNDGIVKSVGLKDPIHVGYGLLNDLVLRVSAFKGRRVMLAARDGLLHLRVLDGNVMVCGQSLSAPNQCTIPPYTLIAADNMAFAVGPEQEEGRWAECERLWRSMAQPPAPETSVPPARPIWRWPGRPVRAAMVAGFCGAIALGWPAPAGSNHGAVDDPVRTAGMLLRDMGYESVHVERQGPSSIEVSGYVPLNADRAHIERLFSQRGLSVRVAVDTAEALGENIQHIMRLKGIGGAVEIVGEGHALISGVSLDPNAQSALIDSLHRDIPALKKVDVSEQIAWRENPTAPSPSPSSIDPAKQIEILVGGPSGYIITSDGSRYFIGSILPSGHKIVDISARSVVVERDGQISRVDL